MADRNVSGLPCKWKRYVVLSVDSCLVTFPVPGVFTGWWIFAFKLFHFEFWCMDDI